MEGAQMQKAIYFRRERTKPVMTLFLIFLITIVASSVWAYGEKNSNANGVRIKVTPQVLSPGMSPQFKISLSTHTVELSQDLKMATELQDDQGRIYKVKRWEGSPPGGHHRAGTLTFPTLHETTGEVTLIFGGMENVPQNTFSWKVK
jgi:hypothetical protein